MWNAEKKNRDIIVSLRCTSGGLILEVEKQGYFLASTMLHTLG